MTKKQERRLFEMKFKRLIAAILALLMLASVLLTSCSKKEDHIEDATGDDVTPPTSSECTHSQTELRNVVAATCISEGYSGDAVCIACGEIITAGSATAKLDHTFDKGRTTKEPTCIETGILTHFCTFCGASSTEALPTVEHDDRFHDALDGGHTITCYNCTKSEYATHTPTDNGKKIAASCSEPAYTLFTCAECGSDYKVYDSTSLEMGHDFGEWIDTLDADCSHNGQKTRECSRCDETETINTPVNPSNHNYELRSSKDATCTEEGSEHYVCSGCDSTKDVTLAKASHSFGSEVTDKDGWTKKTCISCSYTLSSFDASSAKEASFAASALDNDNFEIKLETAAIVFPENVVSQFKNSDKEISIKADTVTESKKNDLISSASSLTDEQKERLNSVDIYDFGVTQGEYVSSFKEDVTVTLPYVLGEDEDPDGIIIWYVKENGQIENIPAEYNEESETVTFSVSHFSYYAIAYEETQEMRCKKGNHDLSIIHDPVPASCHSFGYTVKECSCCHHTQLSNIVEMSDHSYGDIIEPAVDCENGGFKYKQCTTIGCSARVTYEYVRALGHKPTKPATCTEASICSVCNGVVTAAKGHKYTAWETIIEATDTKDGLKRRYCLGCGNIEETTLASTGDVTELDFESYMEMIDYILCDYLGLGKGVITYSMVSDRGEMEFLIKADCNDKDTVFSLSATEKIIYKDDTRSNTVDFIYKNGTIFVNTGEIGTSEYVLLTDVDSVFRSFDGFDYILSTAFDQSVSTMEELFETLDTILLSGAGEFSDKIDELLKNNDIDYTYAELESLYNSCKKLYAYIALRLGKTTEVVAPNGVERPTRQDLFNVLDAFMTKTTEGGNTVYTYDSTEFMDAIRSICDWYFDNKDLPAGNVLFDIFKAQITEKYTNVTDWTSFVARLKSEFGGNIKVSDAIDKIMDYFTDGDAEKLDAIYEAINSIAHKSGNESFDIETALLNYSNQTLDEFAREYIGTNNIAEYFDALSEQLLKMTFGELLGDPVIFDTYSNLLDAITENVNASIVIDAQGNLVSFDVSSKVEVNADSEFASNISNSDIKISFERDNNVSIQIPDTMTSLESKAPNATFDKDGNLVISTSDTSFDYSFGVEGSMVYDLASMAKKDAAMSERYGFDVYNAFVNNYSSSNIYHVNGKFYTGVYNNNSVSNITAKYPLADVLSNSTPDKTTLSVTGHYTEGDVRYDVYSHPLGYIYEAGGVWYLIDRYNSDYNWYGEDLLAFNRVSAVELSKAIAAIRISNFDSYNDDFVADADGSVYNLIRLNIAIDLKGWDNSISSHAIITEAGEMILIEYDYSHDSKFILTNEITEADFPEHTYYTIGYKSSGFNLGMGEVSAIDASIHLPDGTDVTSIAERVYMAVPEPVYYAKIGNLFVDLNDLSTTSVIGKKEFKLPDGNTLYIAGGDYSEDENGNVLFGRVYGYVHLGGAYCVKAAADVEDGKVVGVAYKNAERSLSKTISREIDFDSYVTKGDNGSYIISKDFFNRVKNMTISGYFFIYAIAEKTENGTTYEIVKTYEHSFNAPEETTTLERLDWYTWFGNEEYGSYIVTTNDDGSVSIYFRNGEKIEVRYDLNSSLEITEALSNYDSSMSNDTGLNIYSSTYTESYRNHYVLKDGKPHEYNSYNSVVINKLVSLEDFIHNEWYLNDFYYRYDFTDANGNVIPVYEGRISYNEFPYSDTSSIYRYFVIKEGMFYVLTEVEQLGEGGIKFEDMIPVEEYISGIKLENVDYSNYEYSRVYTNGNLLPVYEVGLEIVGPDNTRDSMWLKYIRSNNSNKLVAEYTTNGYYLVINDSIPTIEGPFTSYTYTSDYVNGSYEFISYEFTPLRTNHFVKLANKLYFYDNSWNSYVDQRLTEEEFMWRFYNIKYDENYNEVYYAPEGMKTLAFDDGTVFYYIEGNTNGYLKDQSGFYSQAELITDEKGDKYAYCYNLRHTISSSQLDTNALFKDCVIFSNSDTVVTFKPEFIDRAEELFGENILDFGGLNIRLGGEYNSVYFSSEEIKGWFE